MSSWPRASRGERRVGVGAVQVAAQAEADLQPAGVGRFDAAERVEARRGRQLDARTRAPGASKTASLSLGVTPTLPMPCTLRVAADRHQPGVRPADHAAHQGQVGDRLHVRHAVGVVRDAHRPAEDDVLRRGIPLGDLVDLALRRRPTWRESRSTAVAPQAAPATRRSPCSARCRNASSCAPISSIRLAMPVSRARSPPMCGCT